VGRVSGFCCAMAKGKFHFVDIIESAGKIDSNFFDLTTSNIASNISNVKNMVVNNVTTGNVETIEVV
jgi:hypothetical protein